MSQKASIIQLQNDKGEIAYPITSSAAIGMSKVNNFSGSLDNYLSNMGGKTFFVFREGESGVSPDTPTGGKWNPTKDEFTAPEGWEKSLTNIKTQKEKIEKNNKAIWQSSCMFNMDGKPGSNGWSFPIQLTGENGQNGKDGANIQYIYLLTKSESIPETPNGEGNDDYTAPSGGWTDHPSGVNNEYICEYVSISKKDEKTGGIWSNWSQPILWSKYGQNGLDGDGLKYAFILSNKKPPKPAGSGTDGEIPAIPSEKPSIWWTDDPTGTDTDNRHEWVTVSKYGFHGDTTKTWSPWSDPTLWASYNNFKVLAAIFKSSQEQPNIPENVTMNLSNNKLNGLEDTGWSEEGETQGELPIWMANGTFDEKGKLLFWSTPVKITGDDGKTGADGTSMQYIYLRVDKVTETPDPPTEKPNDKYEAPTDKWNNYSWTNHPQGVSLHHPIEYMCYAQRISSNILWEDCKWQGPVLWSKYGQNGLDGDGVRYAFTYADKTEQWNGWDKNPPGGGGETPNWGGKEWTDNPRGTSTEHPCEWVTISKYGFHGDTTKKWGSWSKPTLWVEYNQTRINASAFYIGNDNPGKPNGGSFDIAKNILKDLPSGWTNDNINQGNEKVWMSNGIFSNNGTLLSWSEPVCISGPQGVAGMDGSNTQYIYKRIESSESAPIEPPEGTPNDSYEAPEGWTNHPQGITETFIEEYMCYAKKAQGGSWDKNWSSPVLWSKYGKNGLDGDGVKYAFYRAAVEQIWGKWSQIQGNNTDETPFPLDSNWTDNPQGVGELNEYEYVSTVKRISNKWGYWSKPSLWAKYGQNGATGEKGASPRMRGWWNKIKDNDEIYSGETGEDYFDLVYYSPNNSEADKKTYKCAKTHNKSEANKPGNNEYWREAEQFEFIATDLLNAEDIISKAINTGNITVGGTWTGKQGEIETQVVTENGKIEFNHRPKGEDIWKNGVTIGLDQKGGSVLTFYGDDGQALYDLGPGGLSASAVQSPKVKSEDILNKNFMEQQNLPIPVDNSEVLGYGYYKESEEDILLNTEGSNLNVPTGTVNQTDINQPVGECHTIDPGNSKVHLSEPFAICNPIKFVAAPAVKNTVGPVDPPSSSQVYQVLNNPTTDGKNPGVKGYGTSNDPTDEDYGGGTVQGVDTTGVSNITYGARTIGGAAYSKPTKNLKYDEITYKFNQSEIKNSYGILTKPIRPYIEYEVTADNNTTLDDVYKDPSDYTGLSPEDASNNRFHWVKVSGNNEYVYHLVWKKFDLKTVNSIYGDLDEIRKNKIINIVNTATALIAAFAKKPSDPSTIGAQVKYSLNDLENPIYKNNNIYDFSQSTNGQIILNQEKLDPFAKIQAIRLAGHLLTMLDSTTTNDPYKFLYFDHNKKLGSNNSIIDVSTGYDYSRGYKFISICNNSSKVGKFAPEQGNIINTYLIEVKWDKSVSNETKARIDVKETNYYSLLK